MNNYPPIDKDLDSNLTDMSVKVLISVEGFDIVTARYSHGGKYWEVAELDYVHLKDSYILEWWPSPESGTGNR